MSDKLTAEEIAKQIREEVATGKYGFVKAVSRALEKHARQEVDEATKPLLDALEQVSDALDAWDSCPSCGTTKREEHEDYCLLIGVDKALTAHYKKYPKEKS